MIEQQKKLLIATHLRKFALFKILALRSICSKKKLAEEAKICKTFWAKELKGIPGDIVSELIQRTGFFEENLCEALINFLSPGMCFIDIGAHIGFHSLLAAHLVKENGCVFAMEPCRETFKTLKENCLVSKNITALEAAAWSSNQIKLLNVFSKDLSAFNSFYEPRMPSRITVKRIPRATFVRSISIDYLVAEYKLTPDFIKIDAESSESEIIKGMTETLEKFKPIISLEVGDHQLPGVSSSASLIQQMLELEYQAYEMQHRHLTKHEIRDKYSYDNLIFIHKARYNSISNKKVV